MKMNELIDYIDEEVQRIRTVFFDKDYEYGEILCNELYVYAVKVIRMKRDPVLWERKIKVLNKFFMLKTWIKNKGGGFEVVIKDD